jgi:3'-phosphoadenosine 5'-phosphosulfate sulfotransferase (PAPS reductase)/FAD synthetase
MEEKHQIEKTEKNIATNEDIREFCQQNNIPYVLLIAAHRQLAKGDPSVQLGDVLYVLYQGQQMGLPVGGPWYSLIPPTQAEREKGRTGCSICFRADAAFYILSHDRRVISYTYFWTDGSGKEHGPDDPPFFPREAGRELPKIDWDLTCTVRVKLRRENSDPIECSVTARFRDWARNADRSYSPWVTNPSHMTFKTAAKLCVRMYLGAALEFDDDIRAAKEIEASTISAPLTQATPVPLGLPSSEASADLSSEEEAELERASAALGRPLEALRAGLKEYRARGGSVADYISSLRRDAAKIEAPSPKAAVEIPEPLMETGEFELL